MYMTNPETPLCDAWKKIKQFDLNAKMCLETSGSLAPSLPVMKGAFQAPTKE